MMWSKICRAERVRLASIGLSALALAAVLLPVQMTTTAEAKTPGETYCYYGVCHRVKTIEETKASVGVDEWIMASHYDDCSRDRYNPCGLTSSGEQFQPDRPDNTASPIYPDGTMLLVWSPETERALVVRVNNAGPYWGDRTLDLSRAAAEKLGFDGRGVAKVRVRVIKAPDPDEATYVANRRYPPVPGDIGEYATLQEAETGMAVALALQATAASPLAPVTTANAFARPDAELLVAEAPQSLGRGRVRVASLPPPDRRNALNLSDILAQTPKPLRPSAGQSYQQVAFLGADPKPRQTPWDGELVDLPPPVTETGSIVADNAEPHEAKVAAAAPVADDVEPVARKKADPAQEAKPKKSNAERSAKKKKIATPSSGSRKTASRNERRSRTSRTAGSERRDERARVAYSDQGSRWREPRPSRTAGQLMSLGIRAQSSSTM